MAKVAAYKVAHGDCDVPQGWPEDKPLADWVNTQQRGKRQLDRGNTAIPHIGGASSARLRLDGCAEMRRCESAGK